MLSAEILEDTGAGDWQKSCVEIKQRGEKLLETGQFSDCTFLVGPERVPVRAHYLLLVSASPVFESMLNNYNCPHNKEPICINNVEPETFRLVLNYVYTDNIKISSYKLAQDMFLCATALALPQLVQVCVTYMTCNMTHVHACKANQLGTVYYQQALVEESIFLIKPNIVEILDDSSFEELDLETVVRIFSIEGLQVADELLLFDALTRYGQALGRRRLKRSVDRQAEGGAAKIMKLDPVETNDFDKNVIISGSQIEFAQSVNVEDIPLSTQQSDEPDVTISMEDDSWLRRLLRPALGQVRLLSLTPQRFAERVARSPLLAPSEVFALLVNIAHPETKLPLPPGFCTNREPRYKLPVPKPPSPAASGFTWLVVTHIHKGLVCVQSAPFEAGGAAWRAVLVPRVHGGSTGGVPYTKHIGLFLRCTRPQPAPWACRVSALFRLLSHRPGGDRSRTLDCVFTSAEPEEGLPTFVSLVEVLSQESGFAKDNKMTVEVRVTARVTSRPAAAPRPRCDCCRRDN